MRGAAVAKKKVGEVSIRRILVRRPHERRTAARGSGPRAEPGPYIKENDDALSALRYLVSYVDRNAGSNETRTVFYARPEARAGGFV